MTPVCTNKANMKEELIKNIIPSTSALTRTSACWVAAPAPAIQGGRTFVHRAFVHDWHYNDACQVNSPFKTFFFSPCVPKFMALLAI